MTTITINGKQLPFRLTFRALEAVFLKTGMTIQTMGDIDLKHLPVFAEAAINKGFEKLESKETIDEKGVRDLLDEDFSGVAAISTAISSEMENIFPQGEGVEDGKK